MDADAYRSAIKKLGMSQQRAARFFEVGPSNGARWAKNGPPPAVGMLLNLMLALHVKPDTVDFWLGRGKAGDD